jgi:4-amino-4-deoxy-L-arabinose transferase-like glycosyltransferase
VRRPAEKAPVAFAARSVLAVIALKCALELAVAGRYGWHRDELYYAVAGLHLQGGYVEFPPVTALLAALARVLFGWSLVGLRAFTSFASAGTVLVGALIARELGATRRAQTLAAVVVGLVPGMLATNLLFQPVALDQLTTMTVLWLALRLALGRGSWPLLGVAVGIGLETKYTLAVVLVLLVATFLVWRRDVLRSWVSCWRWASRPRCSSPTSSGKQVTAGRACTSSSTLRRAGATSPGRSS